MVGLNVIPIIIIITFLITAIIFMITARKKENIFLIDDRKKCNDCQLNEGQDINLGGDLSSWHGQDPGQAAGKLCYRLLSGSVRLLHHPSLLWLGTILTGLINTSSGLMPSNSQPPFYHHPLPWPSCWQYSVTPLTPGSMSDVTLSSMLWEQEDINHFIFLATFLYLSS